MTWTATTLIETLQLTDGAFYQAVHLHARPLKWFLNAECIAKIVASATRRGDRKLAATWLADPLLPNEIGSMLIPAALGNAATLPDASNAILLPIQWHDRSLNSGDVAVNGVGETASRLPAALCDLAQTVARCLGDSPRLDGRFDNLDPENWCIRMADVDGWNQVDLSDLEFDTVGSAWASLASGLLGAWNGAPFAPLPVATGEFDPRSGNWQVAPHTVADKLSAALRISAEVIAVPMSVHSLAQQWVAEQGLSESQCEVVALSNDADLSSAVEPLMRKTEQPPSPDASIEEITNHYTNAKLSDRDAREYYSTILSRVADGPLRELERNGLGRDVWQPSDLVSIVSNSDELILLATELFRPTRLHLIYTVDPSDPRGDFTGKFNKLSESLRNRFAWLSDQESINGIAVLNSRQGLMQITQALTGIERDAGGLLFDATPGKRVMQMAMNGCVEVGDHVFCWYHDTDRQSRRARPFSIAPLIWEVTTEGSKQRISIEAGTFAE